MMGGNVEGVDKVEEADGKYAFFMESASIEYLVERRCKLSQVMPSFKNTPKSLIFTLRFAVILRIGLLQTSLRSGWRTVGQQRLRHRYQEGNPLQELPGPGHP